MNPDILELAVEFGYQENPDLRRFHQLLVEAVSTATPTRVLWREYLDRGDQLVDFPNDARRARKARIGQQIVQASIFEAAGESVKCLFWLKLAAQSANAFEIPAATRVIMDAIETIGSEAEQLMAEAEIYIDMDNRRAARRRFHQAISCYLEGEADQSITRLHLGHIELRLAQCYIGLLMLNSKDKDRLKGLVASSLVAARRLLEGSHEQVWAQATLDDPNRQCWWQSAGQP
jgi:hypothetical protein